eukprot:TRINITY_DN184_c0_g1_i13.p1 TRINITY_DN184_c0_g1~~TRINITY_DN184_c0_g1_i13.p1  ORF type:complete len:201 (+),score=46.39 TRINITY_DN184_c0_g1_i13:506-1108(+)
MANVMSNFVGSLVQFTVFASALFSLLSMRKSVIERCEAPLGDLGTLFIAIGQTITEVFATMAKLFFFHAIFTWLTFSIMDLQFGILMSLVSGFFSVVPLFNPLAIVLPVMFIFLHDRLVAFGVCAALQFAVSSSVDGAIYADVHEADPTLTAMSLLLGFSTFGLNGVFLGPILIAIPIIVTRRYSQLAGTLPQLINKVAH